MVLFLSVLYLFCEMESVGGVVKSGTIIFGNVIYILKIFQNSQLLAYVCYAFVFLFPVGEVCY